MKKLQFWGINLMIIMEETRDRETDSYRHIVNGIPLLCVIIVGSHN